MLGHLCRFAKPFQSVAWHIEVHKNASCPNQTLLQVRVPKAFLEASGSYKKVPPSPKKGIKDVLQGDVLITCSACRLYSWNMEH